MVIGRYVGIEGDAGGRNWWVWRGDLARVDESTAEMGDFLSRCEPVRMMCDKCSLAEVVARARRRAAVLSGELRRLEAVVQKPGRYCG